MSRNGARAEPRHVTATGRLIIWPRRGLTNFWGCVTNFEDLLGEILSLVETYVYYHLIYECSIDVMAPRTFAVLFRLSAQSQMEQSPYSCHMTIWQQDSKFQHWWCQNWPFDKVPSQFRVPHIPANFIPKICCNIYIYICVCVCVCVYIIPTRCY
jgi:hypothetical protein